MPWFILGLGLLVGLILIIRGLAGLNPRRAIQAVILMVLLIVGGAAVYLIVSRGLGAILVALAFLVPMIARWRAAGRFFRNLGGPQPGQSSAVETRFLRMNLDHDTGMLDGLVLEGAFRGRRLGELALAELQELLRECRVEDPESVNVLEAYLERVHGVGGGDGGGQQQGARTGGAMSRDEAYEILGLKSGATVEQVKEAHHRLMKKIHPDQGGSNYLATKINQAKSLLIGE
jgi:hypothetical protein